MRSIKQLQMIPKTKKVPKFVYQKPFEMEHTHKKGDLNSTAVSVFSLPMLVFVLGREIDLGSKLRRGTQKRPRSWPQQE